MKTKYIFLFSFKFYQYLFVRLARFFLSVIRQFKQSQMLPLRLNHLARRTDLILQEPQRLFISKSASIGKNVILAAPSGLAPEDAAQIIIGDEVFLGTGVELGLVPGGILSIGRNTSMHCGTVILGNVKIGCNCIFSYNIFIASGTHVVNAKPTWLIKDQDEHFLAEHPLESVIIEDDVWLGWGVFIKSGVHIGRGAIIGANSVVTRDIEPYSICAGVPARIIEHRLIFTPPHCVHAERDDDLPYFYAGFKDDQKSLTASRREGVIWADYHSRLILQHSNPTALQISGRINKQNKEKLTVSLYLNKQLLAEFEVSDGTFVREFKLNAENIPPSTNMPQYFSSFIEISITYAGAPSFSLGITHIKLLDQPSILTC